MGWSCRIYTVDCRWVDSGGGGVGWLAIMGDILSRGCSRHTRNPLTRGELPFKEHIISLNKNLIAKFVQVIAKSVLF